MKVRRLVGWLILIPAFVFWLVAIGSAAFYPGEGYFADPYAYQIIVMGGALSTISALLLNADVFAS